MNPQNKAHFQRRRQLSLKSWYVCVRVCVWQGGSREKTPSKSPGSAGKQKTSSETESDTFSPNVILLEETITEVQNKHHLGFQN